MKTDSALNYPDLISPTSVEDFIIPKQHSMILKNWVRQTKSPINLILFGPPGCGKSTCLRILTTKVEAMHHIATTRGKNQEFIHNATSFARTVSMFNLPKVLFIDEIDALTEKDQRVISSILDTTSIRLVASTNYLDRIYPALRSRCLTLDFDPGLLRVDEVIGRFLENTKRKCIAAGVSYDAQVIVTAVKQGYPDFRRIGNLVHALS